MLQMVFIAVRQFLNALLVFCSPQLHRPMNHGGFVTRFGDDLTGFLKGFNSRFLTLV